MDVKSVSSRAKVLALGLVIACGGSGGAALAASASPQGHITQSVRGRSVSPLATPDDSGYELDYFHVYKAARTYAIRLKNGLHASFDFKHGTATLYYGNGQHSTLPLEQVLLQANNGNANAAAEMYDQMLQSVTAQHADAIMAYAGPGTTHTNVFEPPVTRLPGSPLEGPLWATPIAGGCSPIPFPCNEFSGGGLSNWGSYNQWWGSGVGDPAPTPQPPRPDGCNPNDIDCILWEHDRKGACDDLYMDNATLYGLDASVGYVCATAATGVGALACAGALITYGAAQYKLQKDTKQCRTPYPGTSW